MPAAMLFGRAHMGIVFCRCECTASVKFSTRAAWTRTAADKQSDDGRNNPTGSPQRPPPPSPDARFDAGGPVAGTPAPLRGKAFPFDLAKPKQSRASSSTPRYSFAQRTMLPGRERER